MYFNCYIIISFLDQNTTLKNSNNSNILNNTYNGKQHKVLITCVMCTMSYCILYVG